MYIYRRHVVTTSIYCYGKKKKKQWQKHGPHRPHLLF